jgi:hypothetical protein
VIDAAARRTHSRLTLLLTVRRALEQREKESQHLLAERLRERQAVRALAAQAKARFHAHTQEQVSCLPSCSVQHSELSCCVLLMMQQAAALIETGVVGQIVEQERKLLVGSRFFLCSGADFASVVLQHDADSSKLYGDGETLESPTAADEERVGTIASVAEIVLSSQSSVAAGTRPAGSA